ncbi:MAG: hypothetical protein AB7H97_05310 [Pseudobdellovibrionaceae bacterium]
MMSPPAVREAVHALLKTAVPEAKAERELLISEIRAAANVLLGYSDFGDGDVKKAFQAARELSRGQKMIANLYPLTVSPEPVAQFRIKDLGVLKHRFAQLILRAYPVFRSHTMDKPVAYVTKIVLDVGVNDEELFKRLFNGRAFLHESISASLKSHREDLIGIGASLICPREDEVPDPGRMKAVLISPVVTDAFAYTHSEYRQLNRDHQDFLSFFKDMKKYPDEVICEILHMIGIATDRTQFND